MSESKKSNVLSVVFLLITIVVLILLFVGGYYTQKSERRLDKYMATITITYNEVSLKGIAKLEQKIRKDYKDACLIDVDVDKLYGSDLEEIGIREVNGRGVLLSELDTPSATYYNNVIDNTWEDVVDSSDTNLIARNNYIIEEYPIHSKIEIGGKTSIAQ